MCTCEWADRWVQLQLPLHSSHLRPPTNCTPFAYTGIPAHMEAGTFTEERKRRKASARLVYFGRPLRSGFSFDVPDLRSKISRVSLARNPCVTLSSAFLLAPIPKIPSLSDFVKSAGITTLVRMGRDVVWRVTLGALPRNCASRRRRHANASSQVRKNTIL